MKVQLFEMFSSLTEVCDIMELLFDGIEILKAAGSILVSLIMFLIGLAIDYLIATEFANIAEMKGHERRKYFWYTFIFTVIGMLMVIALPDRVDLQAKSPCKQPAAQVRKPVQTDVTVTDESLDIEEASTVPPATIQAVICPACNTVQSAGSKKCLCCGKRLS